MEPTKEGVIKTLQGAFGLTDISVGAIVASLLIIPILVKFIVFIIHRIDSRNSRKLDIALKIINGDISLEKIRSQPSSIKQIFYSNLKLTDSKDTYENDFLLTCENLSIPLYKIDSLKTGGIIQFDDGYYKKTIREFVEQWANKYWLYTPVMVLCFFISIIIFSILIGVFFKSLTFFVIVIVIHLIAEVYFFNINDAVWNYRKNKDDIINLIDESIKYKATHDV